MNKLKEQKGITLIALVITIIVMLILVAVTITMAVNGGLFDYARKAGQETNRAIANEQQFANLEENMTVDDLINKYIKPDYTLEDLELEVGSEVTFEVREASYTAKYNQTGYEDDQTFTTVGKGEITWQVLRQEGDNIVLVGPQTTTGGVDSDGYFYLEGARGYLYGPNELNEICKAIFSYKDENGKVYEARSINEADFLKVSGYDPSTYVNEDENYGKKISEIVTNVNNTKHPVDNNGTPEIRDGFSETIKYDYYFIDLDNINITNEEKNLLLGENREAYYWVASRAIYSLPDYACFNLRYINEAGMDSDATLIFSDGDVSSQQKFVRPVISLPSSVVKAIIDAE